MDRKRLGELREMRGALGDKMRAITERGEVEQRDLHPDEARDFDKLEAQSDKLAAQIDVIERQQDGRATRPGWVTPDTSPSAGFSEARRPRALLRREDRMADHVPVDESRFSRDDAAEFSLGRAVRGMATGNWEDADLERRALAEGATSTGGALVPTPMAAFAIDRLRNTARVIQAGATTVPMTSETTSVPRLAADPQAGWKVENAVAVQGDPAFERVTLTAKTLAVQVLLSFELAEDMSASSAALITSALDKSLALELDRVALRGSGVAPEPLGVRNQPGVLVQSLGANGAIPTDFGLLVAADGALAQQNVEANAAILSPRTMQTFAGLKDSMGQPLRPPPALDDLALLDTNQVPVNVTQGTSATSSEVYTADWSNLLIGVRPQLGVRILKSSDRYIDQLSAVIVAWLRADIALAHPAAFAVTTGVNA